MADRELEVSGVVIVVINDTPQRNEPGNPY
jgi:hypothetical protein